MTDTRKISEENKPYERKMIKIGLAIVVIVAAIGRKFRLVA